MTHPEFAISGSFAHLKTGKLPPKHDPRTLQLAAYLDDSVVLPDVPTVEDWTLGVRVWPMYGNDRLGDCTCAAAGHMVQAWSTAAGHPKLPSDADVVGLYWKTGTTDSGRYELDILNYWRHKGFGHDRITAYVAVDPKNTVHVKAAIYLFGGVYTGIALPKTAQTQQVWDVVGDGLTGDSAPGSWGGHAVPFHAYRQDGEQAVFTCVTWGGKLDLTEAFHLAYTDECYAVLSHDWMTSSKESPVGFDFAALTHDLGAIRG